MIKRLPEILALILAALAVFLIVRQQFVGDDRLFNFRQIWHHETLIAAFIFGAVCLLLGKYLGRAR